MKKLLYLLTLIVGLQTQAQMAFNKLPKTGILTGLVIDNKTKEPVPFATIVIKDTTNKVITGGITNELGKFKIAQIPQSKIFFEVQFMGYKTFKKSITITQETSKQNLGTIKLIEDTANLDEVEIVAETSTIVQKIDRKVINVGKDLVAVGATASDIMNNIPSVSVDQNGNISLRGNTNVKILIDGKPTNISAAQLLKQIPSSSIKSIELITNPSAKYNPEGMSGIINIILRKNSNLGFNASLNSGFNQGKNGRLNTSLNMNYKVGKFNFFTNYGLNLGNSNNYGNINRTDNNSIQKFNFNNNSKSNLIKLGVDFYLNDKNTISVYTNQNIYNSRGINVSLVNFLSHNFDNFDQRNIILNNNYTQTYNFDYKIDFNKEGHNLELEVNYATTNSDENANYKELINPSNRILNYDDFVGNDRNNTTINLDYANPISKNAKWEIGLESRLRRTDNTKNTTQFQYDNTFNLIPVPNTFYQYNRNINSMYATYSHKFKKLSVQIGARLENYDVTAILDQIKIFYDNYITLYPSAFFTFNPSEKNQFQFSYSRRVDRPGLNQVNPIREWSTPQITSVGNPELRPQFTNSFEVNYTKTLKNGSITFGTFYRRIHDNINRALLIDPLDVNKIILTYINSDNTNAYGFEASNNYRITKWWRINSSFDLYSQKENGIVGGNQVSVTNTTWNFRANNDFKATKNLRFQWFGLYRGANKNLQFNVNPMWKMDLGTRLSIIKGKGSLSLRFNDIFNSMHFGFDSTRPYPQNGKFYWESQSIYAGFTYRFGGGKNKSRNRKNRKGNDKKGSGFI